MKKRMLHRVFVPLVLCLLAGLSGCTQKALDANQILSQAQEYLSSLNSYVVRMSVDVRAMPVNGDVLDETSIALDTYTQVTTGCQAMCRSAQYTIYKDWLWSLVSSVEYQFPEDSETSAYYYSCNETDYFLQKRQTVDYTLDLASFFGSDVTASATRYDGTKAYLLTGSLADAHLEQLLPLDGDVARVLRQVPLTAVVTAYLDQETLEPLSMAITCTDPDGSLRNALNCAGGTLNICRISLSFSSLDGLSDLTMPEELSSATELDPNWAGPPQDEYNTVLLEQSSHQVHIPIPATYTQFHLPSTPSSLVLRKFTDGHAIDVTYLLTEEENALHPTQALADHYAAIVPGPKGQEAYTDVDMGTVPPMTVNGRQVEGEYVTYCYTDDHLKKTYTVEYSLWTQLDNGAWLQCLVKDATANEKTYEIDAKAFAELLFAEIS